MRVVQTTEAHNNYADSPTLLQSNVYKDKVNEVIDTLASHNKITYLKFQPMPIHTAHTYWW